jgi:exodeoxyribonuclease VII large subunit
VLSAIGHQVDNPLLDLVADFKTPTPSLAAQFIVDHNHSYLQELQKIKESCKEKLLNVIQEHEKQISNLLEKLYKPIYEILQLKSNLQNTLLQSIQHDLHRLCKMEISLQHDDNIKILFDGKQILSPQDLENLKQKTLNLVWCTKIYKIKFI